MVLSDGINKEKERIISIERIIPRERLFFDEPMSRHTSFRIGGSAALLVQINNEEELRDVLTALNEAGSEYMLIGNGSNLLVSDEGYPGTVLKLGGDFAKIVQDEDDEALVHVGAARLMSGVSSFLAERGLSGFEFASGIPGSIGGAAFMNAGAYGGEMKDVVESVRVMALRQSEKKQFRSFDSARLTARSAQDDKQNVILRECSDRRILKSPVTAFKVTNKDLDFSYRHSRLQEENLIVLSVTLRLKKDSPEAVRERISELATKRNSKQPVNMPSAGSTFKRPARGFAAALIEEAGLKGYRVGGAVVSEKHAGFVVNDGGATCKDVLSVMRHVRRSVLEKSGIELEPEVRLVNCEL